MAADEPVEEVLAREAAAAPRAGIAALLGGGLAVLSSVALAAVSTGAPDVYLVDALREVSGEDIGRPGLLSEVVRAFDNDAVALIANAIAQVVAVLLQATAIIYLARAVRARRPEFSDLARRLAMTGAIVVGIGTLMFTIDKVLAASDFMSSGDQSSEAARDAIRPGLYVPATAIVSAGSFALAYALIVTALNAMRVGLLTRFLGILGIIVGVTLVLPLDQQGIIRAFWMGALGVLILGRWPRGQPPAWQTGRAEPWPSQQELREQRDAGRARPDAPSDDEERTTGGPSPATSKRKRKRRG